MWCWCTLGIHTDFSCYYCVIIQHCNLFQVPFKKKSTLGWKAFFSPLSLVESRVQVDRQEFEDKYLLLLPLCEGSLCACYKRADHHEAAGMKQWSGQQDARHLDWDWSWLPMLRADWLQPQDTWSSVVPQSASDQSGTSAELTTVWQLGEVLHNILNKGTWCNTEISKLHSTSAKVVPEILHYVAPVSDCRPSVASLLTAASASP